MGNVGMYRSGVVVGCLFTMTLQRSAPPQEGAWSIWVPQRICNRMHDTSGLCKDQHHHKKVHGRSGYRRGSVIACMIPRDPQAKPSDPIS
ncbi:hypothetical protein QE152_g32649 [Popillia japonica]|uniref:Secreted protein n=1 Tax=Popillia japonica TaxID=7064 RepID=A0AAW1IYZ2_POPJA